uniref:Alpha-ketoglutarate-dependent dioxygenase FTO n=1 Tax=Pinguiococcus pyrenoidosus TaxID=172671 RepID=A0A7R9U9D2_9STRA|mmetsp:Transcript_19942/g.75330  ORF Transcript_19942/g.75330 Transcript_19942/m.75330 type:complete len:565 (+) Transcript_19942:25-1719(+)
MDMSDVSQRQKKRAKRRRPVADADFKGFVREEPRWVPPEVHLRTRRALLTLKELGYYIYDVTQPLGLFSELKRTFVSRILVGKEGYTYKYLNLRMFGIPFEGAALDSHPNSRLREALRCLKRLNSTLRRRAEELRAQRGLGEEVSADFNVILINRMGSEDERDELQRKRSLKRDAELGNARVRVSWHADSSLVHFSTIAVYHLLNPEDEVSPQKANQRDYHWKVALRRQIDAEGPHAGRSRRAGNEDLSGGTRPRTASLGPSGSTYYMLGDFNHHHQHAVLAGACERISTTHRVGRSEGHQAQLVIDAARKVLATPKKCLKQWARESRMLDEVEFEWLRQWYIQGAQHAEQRLPFWGKYIEELEAIWRDLEDKEALKVGMLRNASRVIRGRRQQGALASFSRRERKHAEAVDQMGGSKAFAQMEEILRARQRKRDGWAARAADKLWEALPEEMRPLPLLFLQRGEGGNDGRQSASEEAREPPCLPISLAETIQAIQEQRITYEASEASSISTKTASRTPKVPKATKVPKVPKVPKTPKTPKPPKTPETLPATGRKATKKRKRGR